MDLFWLGLQLFFIVAVLLPLAILCGIFIWVSAPWIFWLIGGAIVFAIAKS